MKKSYGMLGLVLGLFACVIVPAGAEDIYRWRMPDGTSLYTDVPYMNGKLRETLTVPPPDSKEIEQADNARLKREEKRVNRVAENRVLSLDAADAEVRAAGNALEAAKIERYAGLQPRAGERLGVVGGHTRLSDEYWRRVRALKRQVDEARERLNQAYVTRNGLN